MSPTLSGKPEVGWHCFDSGSCDEEDPPRADFLAQDRRVPIPQAVGRAAQKGPINLNSAPLNVKRFEYPVGFVGWHFSSIDGSRNLRLHAPVGHTDDVFDCAKPAEVTHTDGSSVVC